MGDLVLVEDWVEFGTKRDEDRGEGEVGQEREGVC
jgi:hypothetical protein